MLAKTKIAVIGAGKLGEAIICGMIDAGVVKKQQFIATVAHRERQTLLQKKLGIETTLSNGEAVRKSQIVLLCVKPQVVGDVLRQVADDLTPQHLLISVAASVTTKFMEAILVKPVPVIRTMPNTPCLIKEGMTAIAPGKHATAHHVQQARKIFDAIGRSLIVDEKHMDAVTGLSASGPAFVYIIIESFIEAGVKVGLPRDVATLLAAQMVHGAASMVLTTGEHPAKLKDVVTTPAGCTIDGILELEDGGLRTTLIKAVVKATVRARELVKWLMRVVMIAGEVAPYAKVGGLADVLGALPPQLEKLGVAVSIIIPRYRSIDLHRYAFKPFPVGHDLNFDVQSAVLPRSSVRVFLIGIDFFFDREGIYLDSATGMDYSDQADRWIAFQRAALEFVRIALSPVDILHCHDHQAALVPGYLRKLYANDPEFARTRSVLTIHNMGYQGIFPREVMARTGFDPAEFHPASAFEYYGQLNFLKVGIAFADLVTTVSPTYAREIQESRELSFGLEGVLRDRSDPTIGILNGIDYDVWNPQTDPLIPAHFNALSEASMEGKVACKKALLRAFGLDQSRMDRPLFSMLSRIDVQKGFDLLAGVLDDMLERDVSFVLLGQGHRDTENRLREIVARHTGRANIRFAYDEALSHLVIAGADIFLMPSKYEPCGLTQMYSMCYGTVPVVRATGGLADTVHEFDSGSGKGTGFSFTAYEPAAFRDAIDRAVQTWNDPNIWKTVMRNGMHSDFSWTRSAQRYIDAYWKLIG